MKRYFPLVALMLCMAIVSWAGSYKWYEGEMVQGTKINYALDEKYDAAAATTALSLKYDKTGGALTGPVQVTSSTDSTFLGGGDVGIGTNTPNALLHVNGYFQASMPVVIAINATDTTIPDATEFLATWTSESIDTHNCFDPASGEFVAPKTGLYAIAAEAYINNGAVPAGQRQVLFRVGAGAELMNLTAPGLANTPTTLFLSGVFYATQGQACSVRFYQNQGAPLVLQGSTSSNSRLKIFMLRAM